MTRLPLVDFAARYSITSHREALEYAESLGLVIGAYDPDVNSDIPREGLTVTEAADIAAKDVSLVYVLVGLTGVGK